MSCAGAGGWPSKESETKEERPVSFSYLCYVVLLYVIKATRPLLGYSDINRCYLSSFSLSKKSHTTSSQLFLHIHHYIM